MRRISMGERSGIVDRLRLTACVALASWTVACNAPVAPPPPAAEPSAAAPAPKSVTTQDQEPVPPCDPRASLRPQGSLPAPGAMPPGSTMARIAERGRLIVGVDQNTYLFGFRDPFSGQLVGFDIDIVHQLSQAVFGDPNRVQYKVVNVRDLIGVMERNEVDLVVRTLTITCTRLEKVEFSTVYYDAGQRVLTTKGSGVTGIDDLGGKRVCAAERSTSLGNIESAPSNPTPIGVPNISDCLVRLQQGDIDAISTDDTLLAGLAAQDPRTEIVGPRFTEEPYGIAVNKATPDLVRFVNGVLERLRSNGTWADIYGQWLLRFGPVPNPPAARYRD